MKYHKKTGYPLVDNMEELKEAEEKGYLMVHAKCCKCGHYYLSLISNAKQVLTKGCVLCTMDTDEEWDPDIAMLR